MSPCVKGGLQAPEMDMLGGRQSRMALSRKPR